MDSTGIPRVSTGKSLASVGFCCGEDGTTGGSLIFLFENFRQNIAKEGKQKEENVVSMPRTHGIILPFNNNKKGIRRKEPLHTIRSGRHALQRGDLAVAQCCLFGLGLLSSRLCVKCGDLSYEVLILRSQLPTDTLIFQKHSKRQL
jgi:hypothetical protein